MKKSAKNKKPSITRSQKFLIGALGGGIVGALGIVASPAIAVYILVGLVVIAAYVAITRWQASQSKSKKWSPWKMSPAPVMGALVIGVTAFAGVQSLGISSAWHPEGKIKKTVQNITAGGSAQDANSESSAVSAKPGDILEYKVTISNDAPWAKDEFNHLAFIKMTDALPAGVELVSNPSQRNVNADLGKIGPGQSVSRSFQVKVTSTTNNGKIKNTACYTGDSVVKDNPQQGCDDAWIKITVPPPPVTPVYSCDLLTLTKGEGRKATAKVSYTAKDGATFKSVSFNWGDGSAATVVSQDTAEHTYGQDGTYTVIATVTVTVNGADKTATSLACSKPVTFTTTTPPPPAPTPVYSCDLLKLTKVEGRTVSAKVDYTAEDGAIFKNVTIDWGDDTTPTAAGVTPIEHTYGEDGDYTVKATVVVTVNGVEKTATEAACNAPISFETTIPPTPPTPTPPTPTPPTPEEVPVTETSLPNVGPSSIIVIVLIAAVAGYLFMALYGTNKGAKAIKFKSGK